MAIDNLGRDVGGSFPTEALVQGLTKNVSEVVKEGNAQSFAGFDSRDSASAAKFDNLLQATKDVASVVGDNLGKSSKDAEAYARQVIETFQNVFKFKAKQDAKGQKEQLGFSKDAVALIDKIYKMGKSPNTFWVGLGHFHPQAITQMQKVLKDCGLCRGGNRATEAVEKAHAQNSKGDIAALAGGSGGSSDVIIEGDAGSTMGDAGPSEKMQLAALGLSGAAMALSAAARQLVSAFGVDVMSVFDGVLSNANSFTMQLRDMVYQTRGFGDENRSIEKTYQLMDSITAETGVRRDTLDNLHLANLKRGLAMESAVLEEGLDYNKVMKMRLRDAKKTLSVGAYSAQQLNMNVEGINNMFMDWKMQLGMSVYEISRMGKGMQEVARATGLSGAELKKALDSSQEIMKAMKKAGQLSAEGAKNVLGMMAAGEKYGISEKVGEMMTAMSGGANAFEGATNEMQVLLMNSARMAGGDLAEKMRFGAVTSNEDQEKIFKEMENVVSHTLKLSDGFAQDLGFEKLDMTNLSGIIQELQDEGRFKEAAQLQFRAKDAFGMEIGEIEQLFKAQIEGMNANKSFGEKIDELNADIDKMRKAGGEGTDAFRELQKRLDETNTNKLEDGFAQWSEVLKTRGADTGELIEELTKTMGADAAREFAANMGGSATEYLSVLSKRAAGAGKDMNDLLEAQGFTASDIKGMLLSNDVDQTKIATDVLSSIGQGLGVSDRVGQDPITEIQDQILRANDYLSKMAQDLRMGMGHKLTKIIFWLAQVGGWIFSILGVLMSYFAAASFFRGGTPTLGAIGGAVGKGARALKSGAGSVMKGAGSVMKGGKNVATGFMGGMKKLFEPLTKGFIRGQKQNKTNTQALMKGIRAQGRVAQEGFRGVTTGIAKEFGPLTKGFARGQKQGKGVVQSLFKGLRAQQNVAKQGVGHLGKASKAFGIFGKIAGPLTIAIGALTGALEAETEGRTRTEGALLGALTGGAGTGSMFSGMLGIEKGTGADKALGVAGATAWGVAAGAAIGSIFPVVGTLVGAVVGGLIGGGMEIIKIITEGTTILSDFVGAFTSLITKPLNMIWEMVSGIGKILAGILSLDIGKIGEGIFDIVFSPFKALYNIVGAILKGLWAIPRFFWQGITMLVSGIFNAIISIPSQLASLGSYIATALWDTFGGAISGIGGMLRAVFVDFPMWLGGIIFNAVVGIGSMLLNGLQAMFVDFPIWLGSTLYAGMTAMLYDLPTWIGNQIYDGFIGLMNIGEWIESGFQSLMNNEWLKPIIEPFYEIWEELGAIGSSIVDPFRDAFGVIAKAFEPITSLFSSSGDDSVVLAGAMGFLSGAMQGVGNIIGVLAHVAGGLISFALWPITVGLRALTAGIQSIIPEFDSLTGLIGGVLAMIATLPLQIPRLIYGIISSIFNQIGSLADGIEGPLGAVLQTILYPFKLIGGLVGAFSSAMSSIVNGLGSIFGGVLDTIVGIFTLDFGLIGDGLWGIVSGLGSMLYGLFLEVPVWLGTALFEGITGIGSMLLTGLQAIYIDFPTWLWDTITGGLASIGNWLHSTFVQPLSNIGTWLWDTIVEGLSGLTDWLVSLIPGGKGMSEGLSETNTEAALRVAEEGSSISHGIGRTVGGVSDMLTGGGEGRWEGTKKALGGAWEGTKATASYFNPFSYFDEGTREIKNPGVAVLHEGEMVMPKNIWESIKAAGSGAFGSGGGITDAFTNMMNPTANIQNDMKAGNINSTSSFDLASNNIIAEANSKDVFGMEIGEMENLFKAQGSIGTEVNEFSSIKSIEVNGIMDMKNILLDIGKALIGLEFSKNSSGLMETVGNIGGGIVEMMNPFSAMETVGNIGGGIVDMMNPFSAMESIEKLNPLSWFGGNSPEEKHKKAIDSKASSNEKTNVADAGTGLYYDMGAITSSIINSITNPVAAVASPSVLNPLGFGNKDSSEDQHKKAIDAKGSSDKKTTMADSGTGLYYDMGAIASSIINSITNPVAAVASPSVLNPLGFGNKNSSEDQHKKAIESKESSDKKTTMADSGKGLYYDMDSIANSIVNTISNPIGAVSSTLDWLTGNNAQQSDTNSGTGLNYTSQIKGDASAGFGLDYRDNIKGEVSSVSMTMAEAQRRTSQDRVSEAGGTSVALGMGGVESQLQEEISIMQLMYDTLMAIKDNTANKAGTSTKVVGPGGGGLPAPNAVGVKAMARDYVRGYWDLTGNDMSPPAVNNDGRGGN